MPDVVGRQDPTVLFEMLDALSEENNNSGGNTTQNNGRYRRNYSANNG